MAPRPRQLTDRAEEEASGQRTHSKLKSCRLLGSVSVP